MELNYVILKRRQKYTSKKLGRNSLQTFFWAATIFFKLQQPVKECMQLANIRFIWGMYAMSRARNKTSLAC